MGEEWGSWIKPLSKSVKQRAALVIEIGLLTFAPRLYEAGRDGTKVTDEDLKAWARNNPDATKIHLEGLTSLTCDGVIEAIKMLPRLKKLVLIECVRRARHSRASQGHNLRGRVFGTWPGVLKST